MSASEIHVFDGNSHTADPFWRLLHERQIFDATTPPSDVVLVRHGQFELNLPRTPTDDPAVLAAMNRAAYQADYTLGLDEVGQEQGRQVGRLLLEMFPDITKCFASPYPRALEMAGLALPGAEVIEERNLAERWRGDVTGTPPA